MLSFEEALQRLLSFIPETKTVRLPLSECRDRVLAEEVRAERDLPGFTKSLVDGYAVRSIDLARGWRRLRVIGEAPAGGLPAVREVGPGECVRIMTGAPLPDGADAVQMLEEVEAISSLEVVLRTPVDKGANLLPAASEVKRGQVLLNAARRLGAVELAVLAVAGKAAAEVYPAPRVAIVSSGDELVAPGSPLQAGQVHDSNGVMLAARARELGAEVTGPDRVTDNPEAIRALLAEAGEQDVLVFSGGVSAGDYDFVHRLLAEAGFEVIFHRLRIKPGKPVLAARRGRQLGFGLPGNPVSAIVTFELFVRTALRRMMGIESATLPSLKATLLEPVCQRPGRLFFKGGRLSWNQTAGWVATPVGTAGSSDIAAFSQADCLIRVPEDCEQLESGALVEVLVLDRCQGWLGR